MAPGIREGTAGHARGLTPTRTGRLKDGGVLEIPLLVYDYVSRCTNNLTICCVSVDLRKHTLPK
jgi:hypothetical protein